MWWGREQSGLWSNGNNFLKKGTMKMFIPISSIWEKSGYYSIPKLLTLIHSTAMWPCEVFKILFDLSEIELNHCFKQDLQIDSKFWVEFDAFEPFHWDLTEIQKFQRLIKASYKSVSFFCCLCNFVFLQSLVLLAKWREKKQWFDLFCAFLTQMFTFSWKFLCFLKSILFNSYSSLNGKIKQHNILVLSCSLIFCTFNPVFPLSFIWLHPAPENTFSLFVTYISCFALSFLLFSYSETECLLLETVHHVNECTLSMKIFNHSDKIV